MRKCLIAAAIVLAASTVGYATPHVVQSRQAGDDALTCPQIKSQYQAAPKYETDARDERGVIGKNAAAVILFWPALIGPYMNTEDAIKAARERQTILADLSVKKGCGPVTG